MIYIQAGLKESHWPCVTDSSGITTYRFMALGREMSTPPTLQMEYDTLYLFFLGLKGFCFGGTCLTRSDL